MSIDLSGHNAYSLSWMRENRNRWQRPNYGKPPMTSQLKLALLSLAVIIVLASMSMRG